MATDESKVFDWAQDREFGEAHPMWVTTDDTTSFSLWNLSPNNQRAIIQLLYVALANAHRWKFLPTISRFDVDQHDADDSSQDPELMGPSTYEVRVVIDTIHYFLDHQAIPRACQSFMETILSTVTQQLHSASMNENRRTAWDPYDPLAIYTGLQWASDVYDSAVQVYNEISRCFWEKS